MEQNFERSYHISEVDLISECERINCCAMRDINDFTRYKVTKEYLLDFERATLFFSDFLTEEEMQDEVNIITENKEGIADLIFRKICVIRTMVEDLWGKTGRYKTFGFDDMSNMTDSDLLLMVKRVVRVTKRFFADLEMRGLMQEDLNQLMELGQQFFSAMNLENAAIEDRNMNSRVRTTLCNNLYQVVSFLSQTGMCIYEDSNDVKYNDYLLCLKRSMASQLPQTA